MQRIIAAALFCLCLVAPASAQKTPSQLQTEINTNIPDNTTGAITPALLRSPISDIVSSIMPSVAPVSGNLACFNGTTGLLQDCGSAPSQFLIGTKSGTTSVFVTASGALTSGNCAQFDAFGNVTAAAAPCGSGGGGTPGGSNGQVQYNNAGTFGGLTSAQLTTLVNNATASLPGLVPAFPNNATSFLRGDLTWQTLNYAAVNGAAPINSPSFTGTLTFPITGSTQCLTVNTSGTLSGLGAPCPLAANPTATAGTTAVNGSATTFMRSDGAPALPIGSSTTLGVVQVDNTTIGATGGVIRALTSGGTVTSVTGGCGVTATPSTITGSGSISGSATINLQTGTSYSVQSTDCGLLLQLSNASAVAVSLPVATTSGFGAGFYSTVQNIGAGTVTITPTTSTINGGATITLAQFQSVDIYSNGTNYYAATGKSSGTSTITAGTTPTSGMTSGNLIGSSSSLAVDTGVAYTNVATLSGAQTFSGAKTFGQVIGTGRTVSGTTDTLAMTDCGTEVVYTGSSAITVTIPATMTGFCNIAILQAGTAKVSVNGSAVTPATLHSAHSYTGTNLQYSVIGLNIYTTGVAILTGDGS